MIMNFALDEDALVKAIGAEWPEGCPVCGGKQFSYHPVLWPALVTEWQLSPKETRYTDVQQGFNCTHCQSNLRSMTLAHAIRCCQGHSGTLDQWIDSSDSDFVHLLEINEAGSLTSHLKRLRNYAFVSYPETDIHALPYADQSFDLIVHSDTLEHVEQPVHALNECRRVLKPQGRLAYTVPIIIERMSRSRHGLPASYHGAPAENKEDYRVHTEFGADAWTFLMEAGFQQVTIVGVVYPASVAFVACS
jgi:hypothetical protein